MSDPIEKIKNEHEDIERELLELETVMEFSQINYSNLVHVLKKLTNLWEKHESKEEEFIFPLLERKNNFKMPVEKFGFEHKELKPHRESIVQAINSGNEEKVKIKLKEDGKEIIKKLREHIESEDEILYTLSSEELFSEEEINYINKKLSYF